MKKGTFAYLFLGMLASLLVLGATGCARKHIVSSPPTKRPAAQKTAPPRQEEKQVKPGLIEETYVIDAPKEEAPAARVKEGELEDDPLPAPVADAPEEKAIDRPAGEQGTKDAPAPEAQAVPKAGTYFVQIGAFSDLKNANKALARLLSDGYEGSRLSRTDDGLFRVQAGTFPDQDSAEEVLSKLLSDYPNGFVLKTD